MERREEIYKYVNLETEPEVYYLLLENLSKLFAVSENDAKNILILYSNEDIPRRDILLYIFKLLKQYNIDQTVVEDYNLN